MPFTKQPSWRAMSVPIMSICSLLISCLALSLTIFVLLQSHTFGELKSLHISLPSRLYSGVPAPKATQHFRNNQEKVVSANPINLQIEPVRKVSQLRSITPGGPSAKFHFTKQVNYASRNVVLGIAADLDPKNFAIFCGSVRDSSATTEVFVFINHPATSRNLQIAKQYSIHLVTYEIASLQPSYLQHFHPSSLRWVLFKIFMDSDSGSFRNNFDRVIFVDVRDTMFQTDPFSHLPDTTNKFLVFGEENMQSIGKCAWNSGWIKDCFGSFMLSAVTSSPIICSGVSMGTSDMAYQYVQLMSRILTGASEIGRNFPTCERNGVDQGIHNILVHAGWLNNTKILYEKDFPVIHLQSADISLTSKLEKSGGVVHTTRNPTALISIVHQYDRQNSLQQALVQKYVPWINLNDPMAEWKEEKQCNPYSSKMKFDLFKGKCDIGATRVMTAATCCQMCTNYKSKDGTPCQSFTFTAGVCYLKSCEARYAQEMIIEFERNATQLSMEKGIVVTSTPPDLLSAYLKS